MSGSAMAADELHADALDVVTTWSAPDKDQEVLRATYLDLLQRRPDAVWRTCIPAHLTASALVLDNSHERVLLALHRKGGFWGQLGGHCEPGDRSLASAAMREAAEESGIADLDLVSPSPVDLDRHALSAAFGSCGEHLDVRYVLRAPKDARPMVSGESSDLRWFSIDALPATAVADLSRLLNRALVRATQRG